MLAIPTLSQNNLNLSITEFVTPGEGAMTYVWSCFCLQTNMSGTETIHTSGPIVTGSFFMHWVRLFLGQCIKRGCGGGGAGTIPSI